MSTPLIGVPGRRSGKAEGLRTPAVAAGSRYLDAIVRAGAQPVVLSPQPLTRDEAQALVARIDGLCLLGGIDVDPALYGAPAHDEITHTDCALDLFEIALLRACIDAGRPLLAICRGMQVLNVALGGTLIAHLPDVTGEAHRLVYHDVAIASGSRLARAVGGATSCGHSVHHQAIDRVAPGLQVTARSEGGVVEGVELAHGWTIGVQWHPEDSAETDPQQQRLFDALAQAAREGL